MSEENKTEEVKPVVNRRKPVAEVKTEEVKTEEVKAEVKTEEVKVKEVKTEEVKVEEVKVKEVKVEEVKVKEKTAKEIFEASISKTPYTVFQNGTLVFTYNAYHDIKLTEKYFEINFKKYSYNGIEVKHG